MHQSTAQARPLRVPATCATPAEVAAWTLGWQAAHRLRDMEETERRLPKRLRRLAQQAGVSLIGRSLIVGLLVLAVPASTLAVSTSATSAQSATVLDTISLSGVPATITYPAALAGATVTAPGFTLSYSSSAAAGLTVNVDPGAGLTDGSGHPIPVGAETLAVNGNTAQALTSGANFVNILLAAGPGSSSVVFGLVLPAAQPGGAYTGTLTFTAATR